MHTCCLVNFDGYRQVTQRRKKRGKGGCLLHLEGESTICWLALYLKWLWLKEAREQHLDQHDEEHEGPTRGDYPDTTGQLQ
jgi:hypothetical protein